MGKLKPSFFRVVLDWPSLQPERGKPADLEHPYDGCLRGTPPCAGWAGVKDQLAALASRQKQHKGGWEVLVVITGTPDWAARPASGCERPSAQPRSRAPKACGDGRLSQARRGRDRARRQARRRAALLERLERAQPPVLHLAAAGDLRDDREVAGRHALRGADAQPQARARRRPRRPGVRARRARRPRREQASEHLDPRVPARAAARHRLRLDDPLPARLRHGHQPGRRRREGRRDPPLRQEARRVDDGDRRRGAARGPGQADHRAGRAPGLPAAAPPAGQVVRRPARHRGLPVHLPRGRRLPHRARHHLAGPRLPRAQGVAGVGRHGAPEADRPAALTRSLRDLSSLRLSDPPARAATARGS